MGVRGLTSYMMSCQRACCEYVELSAGGSVDVDAQAEEAVRLAVDGLALVYHVMQSPGEHELHLDLGCDYLALFEALRDYLVAVTAAGIVPYVIVDGMQDGGKESTTLERRRVQAVKACETMDIIGAEQATASDNSGPQRPSLLPLFAVETLTAACHSAGISVRAALWEADPELAAACRPRRPKHASKGSVNPPGEDRQGGEDDDKGLEPEHFRPAKTTRKSPERKTSSCCPGAPGCVLDGTGAAGSVRSKQPVNVSDEVGLATELPKLRMGDGGGGVCHPVGVCNERGDGSGGWGLGCAAVLSNDSDFMVMDIPGYIPFWSLGVGENGSAGALVFRRRLLAARLGIPDDRMPDLACLVGNDWIQPNADVQRTILEEAWLNGQGKGDGNGCSVNNGRRKKGKSVAKNSRNNPTHSSAPSAKELVEATGRFLSRFYRSSEALQRKRILNTEEIGLRSDHDDSATLLCSRFFPGLKGESPLKRKVIDACRKQDYPADDRSTGKSGETYEMTSGPGGSHSNTPPVGTMDGDCDNPGSKTSEEHQPLGDDSPASLPKRSNHRKKCGKGKGKRKGKGSSSGRKRGQSPHVLKSPAIDDQSSTPVRVGSEHGQAFLRDFKAARRHYEVPAGGVSSDDATSFEHCSGKPLSATLGVGGLASPLGLSAGVSVPSVVAQAVLEGVFWCRVMLEDTPAPFDASASRPRSANSPVKSSATPGSLPIFGETSCAFGRLEGVRKRIYELCLEAIVSSSKWGPGALAFGCPDPIASSSGKISTEQKIGNGSGRGHTEELDIGKMENLVGQRQPGLRFGEREGARGRSLSLSLGDEWVVTEFRRVRKTVRPFQVSCRVPTTISTWSKRNKGMSKGNKGMATNGCSGLSGHIDDIVGWRKCLSVLGLEGEFNHRLAERITEWLTGNRVASIDEDDARTPSGSTSPALVGITLVAVLLLSTLSQQQNNSSDIFPWDSGSNYNGGMKLSGSRCRLRDGMSWEKCQEADVVLAFVGTATHDVLNRFRIPEKEHLKRGGFPRGEGSHEYAVPGLEKWKYCHNGSPACGCPCYLNHGDEVDESFSDSDVHVGEVNRLPLRFTSGPLSLPKEKWEKTILDHDREHVVPDGVYEDEVPGERNGDQGCSCQCCSEACEETSDEGINEVFCGDFGDEVREFVGLWSRVQVAVWHVNTCLGVLGLDGTGRGSPGYCTAVNPLSLRPAFALDIFLRRKTFRRNCLLTLGEQRRRRCLTKARDPGIGDHLREDRQCPWDRLSEGGKYQHGTGPREGCCCSWWYSMAERCRGDCDWASRVRTVLGAVTTGGP